MHEKYLIIIMYGTILFELITAIIGTIYFYKYKNTKLHNFIYLIWYIALNEIIVGILLKRILKIQELDWLYNIYYLVYFCMLLIIFRSFLKHRKNKVIVTFFIYCYLISLVINGLYQNYLTELQIIPHIFVSCLLIITITFYFIEILNSEKVLEVKRNLLFWISIGLLIHSIGSIPFRILRNYYNGLTDGHVSFLTTVILTVIMNLCFIIGFIWSDRKQLY